MKLPIYLDYSATTPADPRVIDKMVPYLGVKFGNPASHSHSYGWEAEEAVNDARAQVAALVGADPREIVWTSGATEADNLAIRGLPISTKKKVVISSLLRLNTRLCSTQCATLKGKALKSPTLMCRKMA